MKVRFWGTRGSLPAARTGEMIEQKIFRAIRAAQGRRLDDDAAIRDFVRRELPFNIRSTYGTNTPCVELCGGDEYVLCDAGTGIRDFGTRVMADMAERKSPPVFNLFLSHLHWDHIQGFPFFTPAYIPGTRIRVHGCHMELQQALENQQHLLHFPVPLKDMQAEISFHVMQPERTYRVAGFDVRAVRQQHPGDSYGYSFVRDGKKLVYSSDSEHKKDSVNEDYPFVEFLRDADLLIFDAQYTLLDAIHTKENWGHSSNVIGVELAVKAGVKRLCLFHTEHVHDDDMLHDTLAKTMEYLRIHTHDSDRMEIDVAYDGLEIEINNNVIEEIH